MVGLTADAAGQALCAGYTGPFGTMPDVCQVDAGRPMLGIVGIVLFAVLLSLIAWRSLRA